jgi:hypothetical protein
MKVVALSDDNREAIILPQRILRFFYITGSYFSFYAHGRVF